MKKCLTLIIVLAAVIGLPQIVPAQAPSSDEERLQQIERQIAALRSEVEATRAKMSVQRGSGVLPPAEGPHIDAKDYKGPVVEEIESPRWRFSAGAEVLVLEPRWNTNPAYGIDASGNIDSQRNFEHDFVASPVFTAAIVSPSGLGFRARGWWLDSDETIHVSDLAGDNQRIHSARVLGKGFSGDDDDDDNFNYSFRSDLELNHVIDAETTYPVTVGRFTALLSGGVRIASIEQHYDVNRLDLDDDQLDTIRSHHDMDAYGPTFAVEANFDCGHGFLFYSNGRGSLLFGERDEHVTRVFDVASPNFTDSSSQHQDAVVSVAEIEGGVGYKHQWRRFGTELRVGVVGQMWFDAGNSAQAETIVGVDDPDESSDPGADLGLVGFRASAAVTF